MVDNPFCDLSGAALEIYYKNIPDRALSACDCGWGKNTINEQGNSGIVFGNEYWMSWLKMWPWQQFERSRQEYVAAMEELEKKEKKIKEAINCLNQIISNT